MENLELLETIAGKTRPAIVSLHAGKNRKKELLASEAYELAEAMLQVRDEAHKRLEDAKQVFNF